MTTITEIRNSISSMTDAVLCRNKTLGNFVAIPTEDGYVAVKVSALLNKDTENHKAFDVESAKAEYEAFAKAQEEKANKPKKEKVVNTEAEARRQQYDAEVVNFFATTADKGHWYSATEVKSAIPAFAEVTVMAVGSALLRVANSENAPIVCEKDSKKKNLYKIA